MTAARHTPTHESESNRTPPMRLRDRLREQTQLAILDAAEQVMTAEGAMAARIDTIAATAGVSVGTLYNHFADRDALLSAVLGHRRAVLIDRLTDVVEAPDVPFEDRLNDFLHVFTSAGASHGRLFMVVMNEQDSMRLWQCARQETMVAWTALCARLVAEGMVAGHLRDDRPEATTAFLLTLARSCMIGQLLGHPALSARDAADFFLRGASPTHVSTDATGSCQ